MSSMIIHVRRGNGQWITLLIILYFVNVFGNSNVKSDQRKIINKDWVDPLDTYYYDRATKTRRVVKSLELPNHDQSPNVCDGATTSEVGSSKCTNCVTSCRDVPNTRNMNTLTEISCAPAISIVDSETAVRDMLHTGTRSKDLSTSDEVDDSPSIQINEERNPKDKDDMHTVFMKRFVNMLLNAAGLTHSMPGPNRNAEIPISVTSEDLETLKNFGREESVVSLHKLDEILSKMLHSSASNWFKMQTEGWMERITNFFGSKEIYYKMPVICLLLIMSFMLLRGYSIYRIIKAILFMGFITSFMMTYDHMQEVAELKQFVALKQHDRPPEDCLPEAQISWWYWLSSSFSHRTKKCEEYHKRVHLDPRAKVTPGIVLAELVSTIFFHPVDHFGEAVVNLSNQILDGLPWGSKWIVLFLVGAGLVFVFLGVLVVSLGGRVKLPYYLGGVEMSANLQKKIEIIEPTTGNATDRTSSNSLAAPSYNPLEGKLVININIPALASHRQIVEELSLATTTHNESSITGVSQPLILQKCEEVENCENKAFLSDESNGESLPTENILEAETITSINYLEEKITGEVSINQSTQPLCKGTH